MVKNKKGWIKIAEAFLAILLLTSILLVMMRSSEVEDEKSKIINKNQVDFLLSLQINNTFREDILSLNELPINSNESGFPGNLKNYLNEEFSNCLLNICPIEENCQVENDISEEIYSKEILMNSYEDIYAPRKVRMICYE